MEVTSEAQKEQLANGLTRHYLHNKQIAVFTFENIHQSTIDTWAAAVKEAVTTWPADYPFLNIHDYLAVKNMSFTPYMRKTSAELTALAPNKPGRTALILQRTLVSQIVSFFLRTQQNRVRPRRVFFSLEDGIKWCEEMLKPGK